MKNSDSQAAAYWSANVRLIIGSLIIWAIVPFGFGIIFRSAFMGIHIGGADLGLWVAQQGACLTFLVLIFHYAWRMNKLDKQFGAEE